MSYNYLFKFIIVGDSGVGKSCILHRFETDDFSNMTPSTVGIEYVRKQLNIDNNTVMVQVWDTAGQESMFSLTSSYYKNSCAVLLVYDVTRRETFSHLKKWLGQINDNSNPSARRILIGNKCDLDFERLVSRKEGEAFAKENNLPYIETSAKTAKNVHEMFHQMAHEVYMDVKKGTIKVDDDGMFGVKRGNMGSGYDGGNKDESFNIDNKLLGGKKVTKKKDCC